MYTTWSSPTPLTASTPNCARVCCSSVQPSGAMVAVLEPISIRTGRTPNLRFAVRGSSRSGTTSQPSGSATARSTASAPSKSTDFEITSRGPTYTVGRGVTPLTLIAVAGSSTRPSTVAIDAGRGGAGSRSSGLRTGGFFSGCCSMAEGS